jgi:hypothetical protein
MQLVNRMRCVREVSVHPPRLSTAALIDPATALLQLLQLRRAGQL